MEDDMKQAAEQRQSILRQLNKNTIRMRRLTSAAREQGWKAPTIAKHLGVTKRTVYLWSR